MNRSYIIYTFLLLFAGSVSASAQTAKSAGGTYLVTAFGARGNGKTVNTEAINRAIEACAQAGGGQVIVPKGVFLTGTIVLQSHVHLFLEEGAVLRGVTDLNAYQAYVPQKDMTKYGMAYFPNWTRGLIIATGATNFSVTGYGTIDGSHVEDPNGEEGKRGPHMIVFGECRNFEISGLTLVRASNYAYVGYESENATFRNLVMTEGWDGIHIRGAKNILIQNCDFYTGDDAIAGGFWENVSVSECYINSACNGIRVIFPATGLTIADCTFQGPGLHPQRSTFDGQRRNMLGAIIIQPGAWDHSPGPLENIHIRDIEIDDMNAGITFVLHEGNQCGDVWVERVRATNVKYAHSVESWRGGVFRKVVFRDIYTQFMGDASAGIADLRLEKAAIDPRPSPYWGFYARGVQDLRLENVEFDYTGTEVRPALGFEEVAAIRLQQVTCKEVEGMPREVLIRSGIPVNE
ncbi:MAG: right-handed parallel beta-helix repeat-containing protein [Bacteroides sp.]|nr:right-handed parallel beta-helix repeat-containing protein [Bacteroides sp.]